MTIELNEANFQAEVIDSKLPVLVDFWTQQCAPCKALAPILDQLAQEMAGRAKVGKIDAVANMSLAGRYGVRSVPNLLFFQNGEIKDHCIGTVSKERHSGSVADSPRAKCHWRCLFQPTARTASYTAPWASCL